MSKLINLPWNDDCVIDYTKPHDFYKNNTKEIFEGFEVGTVGLVVAPSTAFKSAFSLALHFSCSGYDIDLPVQPISVFKSGFISFEDTKLQIHSRGNSVKSFFKFRKGVTENNHSEISISLKGKLSNIESEDFRSQLTIFAKQNDVIWLDNLPYLHNRNENDNSDMNIVMKHFTDIAEAAKCSIILVQHASKPPSDKEQSKRYFTSQYLCRGASRITDAARWQCNLFKAKHCSYHFTKFKDKKLNDNLVACYLPKDNFKEEDSTLYYLEARNHMNSYVLTNHFNSKPKNEDKYQLIKEDIDEKDLFR